MRRVDRNDVPAVTVPRLALYLRKLRELNARGVARISSKDLAGMIDVNAAQIRKDLSYFGSAGTRGVGYEVEDLTAKITGWLGLDRTWTFVIVGAGLLGTALARYRGFGEQKFRLVAMFDSSPTVIGARYGPDESERVRSVRELDEYLPRGEGGHRHGDRPGRRGREHRAAARGRRCQGGPQLRAHQGPRSGGRACPPGRPLK